MKVKIDDNLPRSLAERLGKFGVDTDTVSVEQLAGRPLGPWQPKMI